MQTQSLLHPDHNDHLLTVVQKKGEIIPLLSEQEKSILVFLAKIFVNNILKSNETSNSIYKNFR
jgi:hypothetical protein